MIEFHDVSVTVASYDESDHNDARHKRPTRRILSDINLVLPQLRIALLGRNGSGKSTFARLINGLTLPTAGQVLVNGQDTTQQPRQVRKTVGFLFADPQAQIIMPTAIEDVSLSLQQIGIGKKVRERQALEILAQFGIEKHAYQPVHTLSGGQAQLLALASVMALSPNVLVCDEPTTHLDMYWREILSEQLLSIDAQVIVATHDLDFAAKCERGLVIENGRVVADQSGEQAVSSYGDLVNRIRASEQ